MANNYLKRNPVANQMSIETFRLFENQDVDKALEISVNTLLSLYKKLTFDLASDRNRTFDSFSKKLITVSDASSIKSLVANIKDVCEDVDLSDSVLAPLKKRYLDSIDMVGDAIKRMIELDPSLEAKAIEYFKKSSKVLMETIKRLADQYQEKLNESTAIGVPGRMERLKRILLNHIVDSKGKDAKSGYGRDWHRLFATLEQKLSAINSDKATFSDADRKNLSELEKKTDSLVQEYNQYKVRAVETMMSKILKDSDLEAKFSDFIEIMTNALDGVTKSNTEEGLIEVKVRENLDDKETRMQDRVFPLKAGDKDNDAKLKGSGLIQAIQKSLIDAFVPIKNLLDPRGGANGNFDTSMGVAVKSIQASLGNKDVSGKLDKPLLDVILKLDQVSSENKDSIKEAIGKLRVSYSTLSESGNALSVSEFMRLMEAMTYIDPNEIEDKIKLYSEEITEDDESMLQPTTSDYSMAEALAKLLRTKDYNKNAEAEDFLKEDGTLKGSCPHDFVSGWTKAVSGDKPVSFFFIEDEEGGSLYPTKRISGNVNKPCNWKRYKSISGDETEDIHKFGKWYTTYWKNFGGVGSEIKGKVLDDVMKSNCSLAKEEKLDDVVTIYEELENSFMPHKEEICHGYLRPESMKGICSSVKGMMGNDGIDNLSPSELRSLYNTVVVTSPLITFDRENDEWVPALNMLCKNLNMSEDELISGIKKNGSLGKSGKMSAEKIAYLDTRPNQDSNNNEILKSTILGSTEDPEKVANMKSTLDKIKSITKSLSKHTKRIGISKSDDISPDVSDSIVIITMEK
jgi:hypothetical protein